MSRQGDKCWSGQLWMAHKRRCGARSTGALALLAVVVEQFEVFGLVSGPGVFLEVAVRSPEGGRGPDRDGGNRAARRSITAGEELRSPRVVRWD
jgi:hypothetical protein